MRLSIFLLSICCLGGCGYHRLDRITKTVPWAVPGETISLGRIYNNTKQGGLEEVFKKSVENRIMASSPWKLVTPGYGSRWVLQGTIDSFEVVPLGLNLRAGQVQGAAGSAARVEIIISASLQLIDGQTGALAVSRPFLTFRNQYRLDQNFASLDNKELQIIEGLADDFAESFLTQLIEGRD
ncbi:MAG: LPS assembly lipoprotein LptE [Holophagaceae bacterium]|nr:LPS assembly lipoprotein LptE [Holophagaceae bacterium]